MKTIKKLLFDNFIFLITFFYALIAFFNLGNFKSPKSFWLGHKNSSVLIDFGEEKKFSCIQIFPGVKHNKKLKIYAYDNNFSDFKEKLNIELKNVSDVFTWREFDFKINSRFIKILFLDNETYINEIAFRSFDNKILEPKLIKDDIGKELFDEQNLVPEYSDFKNSMYFDEVYHVRTAYEFLNSLEVYEVTHPPLGKNIIALGIKIFGLNPFGWRFMGTLCGVIMIPVFYLLSKKIFKNKNLAIFSCLLFCFEFMHFVQTRIATVDSYCVLFILLSSIFVYDFFSIDNLKDISNRKIIKIFFLISFFISLSCAVKWQGFYTLLGIVITLLLNIISQSSFLKQNQIYKIINLFLISFILISIPVYLSSYFLYLNTPSGIHGLRDILNNQNYMYSYHSKLIADHPFGSRWWQWIFNLRPILFYNHEYSKNIRAGISCFMNPLICYCGLISIFIIIFNLFSFNFNKNKIKFFIVINYLSQLVPWIFIKRLTFEYHYFPCTPFLILSITEFIRDIKNKKTKKILSITIIFLSFVLFIFFYSFLSGSPVSVKYTKFLSWFKTWQLT
ncbi:MAG: phospholipid carrier-dependent glycosyltransferase [Clostridiales bacterium]|nr:phospholipid carrier-dependent glycosyltransferase [Clostridiales bacterium]